MDDNDKPQLKMTELELLFWSGYVLMVSGLILSTLRFSQSLPVGAIQIEIGLAIVIATVIKLIINDVRKE